MHLANRFSISTCICSTETSSDHYMCSLCVLSTDFQCQCLLFLFFLRRGWFCWLPSLLALSSPFIWHWADCLWWWGAWGVSKFWCRKKIRRTHMCLESSEAIVTMPFPPPPLSLLIKYVVAMTCGFFVVVFDVPFKYSLFVCISNFPCPLFCGYFLSW